VRGSWEGALPEGLVGPVDLQGGIIDRATRVGVEGVQRARVADCIET
jgi:hypothetical protein